MTDEIFAKFEALVHQAVRPIAASARRKRVIREELLAHLLAVYDDEAARRGDNPTAIRSALRRFGDPAELGAQLQASVPWWERAACGWLYQEETIMTRQWWIGCAIAAAALAALALLLPHFATFILAVGTVTLIGASLVRWRPALGWLVGSFALLFGMGVLLPGMAKAKQAGYVPDAVWGMSLGALIILGGVLLLGYRIRTTWVRPA